VYSIQQCDNVCQWLATGRWFSPGTPVSSNNKTDRHDIAEILLVSFNTLIILYECIYWRFLEGECTFCIQWRFVVWRYFLIFWVQFINVFLGENLIRIYLVYIHFAFLVLNMLLRIILEKNLWLYNFVASRNEHNGCSLYLLVNNKRLLHFMSKLSY
jgi:hypothetical protein